MSHQSTLLEVGSPAELARWTEAASVLTHRVPPIFQVEALVSLGWVAVAIEDELEERSAVQLGTACVAAGMRTAWAVEVPWPPADWTRSAFWFPLTPEGLEAVSKDGLIGSGFVLVEDAGRFAVASDGDGYWMLAGPRNFVESALGAKLADLHEAFGKVVAAYRGEATLSGQRLGAAQAVAMASNR